MNLEFLPQTTRPTAGMQNYGHQPLPPARFVLEHEGQPRAGVEDHQEPPVTRGKSSVERRDGLADTGRQVGSCTRAVGSSNALPRNPGERSPGNVLKEMQHVTTTKLAMVPQTPT
jgi:hypothetical protein